MSTQTEQQYVVHLDIRATALDAAEAVQAALGQILVAMNAGLPDPTPVADPDSARYAGEYLG